MIDVNLTIGTRKPEYPVHDLFIARHSARALSGETVMRADLMSCFEAAKWAPSSFNNQPWRFIFAMRETPHWEKMFNLIGESNKLWIKNAGALVLVVSHKNFSYNGQPSRTHEFDTGAAWACFAIEATERDLIAHAIEGFDYDKARQAYNIPDNYDIEAMIAVGKLGDKEKLPQELKEREVYSTRQALDSLVTEGEFKDNNKVI